MIKSGIINLDKSEGITSQTAVSKIKRIFGIKAGHCGTLDPMASGVLPIMLGAATPFAEFLTSAGKRYVAGIKFGITTDTEDTEGEILKTAVPDFSERELLETVSKFIGKIKQTPPMFSAVKHNGQRLYKLARSGVTVEREAREAEIGGIKILEFCAEKYEAKIEVDCGKGTYIRTLINDIGQALSCGAAMSSLRRTKVGIFEIESAVPLSEIGENHVIPLDEIFKDVLQIEVEDFYKKLLLNGQAVQQSKLGTKVACGEMVRLAGDFEGLISETEYEGKSCLKFIRRHVI